MKSQRQLRTIGYIAQEVMQDSKIDKKGKEHKDVSGSSQDVEKKVQ